LAELDIKMMVEDNQEKHRTAYTVTCDYKHGSYFSLEPQAREEGADNLVILS
jgi:3,4-dihydroxy-2-butanone 4-phosphate synthase